MKVNTRAGRDAPGNGRAPRGLPAILTVFLLAALLGCVHLHFTYQRYLGYAKSEAALLVESMNTLLDLRLIALVSGQPTNPRASEYLPLKRTLTRFREENGQIRFAYLIVERDGKYYLLLDSEPADSPDYSPPGQEYFETSGSVERAFETGLTVVSGPETDRWGTWVSALTPVRDAETGRVLALLGVDYPADAWRLNILRRMVPDFAAALSVTLLAMALCWVLNERLRLSKLNRRLAVDEALFRAVFDQAPIGIAVVRQDSYAFEGLSGNSGINRMFERITGRPRGELVKLKWLDITHPDDIPASLDGYERVKSGQAAGYSAEKRYVRPDGSVVWVNVMISRLVSGDSGAAYFLALLEDITARRQAEDALRESERSKAVLLSHLPGLAYRCRFDRQWTMEFVSEGCLALTGYPPEALLNNRDLSYNDLIAPEDRERLWDAWQTVLAQRESFRQEYQIVTRTGRRKWVLELGQGIYGGDGSVTALEGIVIDITSQKENEARILYLSEHDTLTGLHNRLYYERAQRSLDAQSALPLSVVVCDIDGLHLVNDVFGLEQGDRLIVESARLIQDVRREGDELIRTGGDEFTLIMPRTEAAAAEKVVRRIREAVQAYNAGLEKPACELSLSAGSCTRVSQAFSFAQTVKAAQENMHYHKLLVRRSPHSAILSSVMATMLERSRETEAHGERLVSLSKQLGGRLGLGQKAMDELELYAMLHDIGKVGVDDRILNKPGKLTSEEWESMKKHSEIGYRIAASATELAHVADYILSHHERWDGKGYPHGLAGEKIPLLSRLLAIVDAYDAMTEDRVYRRAMSQEDAVAEIERGAGAQFDPGLARAFIEMVRE